MEIKFENMKFGYSEDAVILNGIDLTISGPQFISIIGPNGVGKSTLIHCINKILTPTSGEVYLNGKNVKEYSLRDMAKEIGYVPYKSQGVFPMLVVDAILLGRNPHASWKTSTKDLLKVEEVMKKLDIEDLAMRNYNELSAGQHQRVMLARGLVQEPKILLLDEPTANLDVKYQIGISRLLKKLSREEDILVIMISHDLNLAARYSDNVILLSGGKVFAVGKPEDVMTEENISKVYGVECKVVEDEGKPLVILEDYSIEESAPQEGSCCIINDDSCKEPVDNPTE